MTIENYNATRTEDNSLTELREQAERLASSNLSDENFLKGSRELYNKIRENALRRYAKNREFYLKKIEEGLMVGKINKEEAWEMTIGAYRGNMYERREYLKILDKLARVIEECEKRINHQNSKVGRTK